MYKIEVYGNVTDDGQSFESNKGNQKARTSNVVAIKMYFNFNRIALGTRRVFEKKAAV